RIRGDGLELLDGSDKVVQFVLARVDEQTVSGDGIRRLRLDHFQPAGMLTRDRVANRLRREANRRDHVWGSPNSSSKRWSKNPFGHSSRKLPSSSSRSRSTTASPRSFEST